MNYEISVQRRSGQCLFSYAYMLGKSLFIVLTSLLYENSRLFYGFISMMFGIL
jgi:hypothetical protein